MTLRIFIKYGMAIWAYGGYATSAGMYHMLGQKLTRYGRVSYHQWDDSSVVSAARAWEGPICLIGYSKGANQIINDARAIRRSTDLLFGYDPSRKSPDVKWDGREWYQNVPDSVDYACCFYNTPPPLFWGGSTYRSEKKLTIVRISATHLAVPYLTNLHEFTINKIKEFVL